MTKTFLGLFGALVVAHTCFDVGVAAGVLALVAGVACCLVVDGAALVGKRLRGAGRGPGAPS